MRTSATVRILDAVTHASELAAHLRTAGRRWSSARGVVRHWRRQELVTLGFNRRVMADAAIGIDWVPLTARADPPTAEERDAVRNDIYESVLNIHAVDAGDRRRADAVSRIGEEWMADSVIYDGPTFWARTGQEVLTNGGNPNSGHGGADFIRLLVPEDVPEGYDLTPLKQTEVVAGRLCDVVDAIPRPPDPTGETPESEVFDMISGGDRFRLSVDQQTGILLRVVKLVDEKPAEIHEFVELALDEPIDDSTFLPDW